MGHKLYIIYFNPNHLGVLEWHIGNDFDVHVDVLLLI